MIVRGDRTPCMVGKKRRRGRPGPCWWWRMSVLL